MSVLSYIAGASVERNINESIRAEESRAHENEVQRLAYRFQAKINELNEDNKRLRAMIDSKDMIIGQKKAEADGLEKKLQGTRNYLSSLKAQNRIENLTMETMEHEVKTLVADTLPGIIEDAFKANGQELNEEISKYIRSHTELALGFSSDPYMRVNFYDKLLDAMNDRTQNGTTSFNFSEMVKVAIEIAKDMKKAKELKGQGEVKGKADMDYVFAGLDAGKPK